jgi:coenzyme F420-reducing hydrogenase delta subunit
MVDTGKLTGDVSLVNSVGADFELMAVLKRETSPVNFEPKILAFACHWCTYSGADLAGLNRMNYPANVRVLRVPCSGRVNPQHVLAALNRGVDGVLVCGCHPGDCHYVSGNYFAKRRLMAFKRLLEYTGLEPERFQVRWISGSEAGKFRDTVISVCEQIQKLGPYVPDPTVGQGSGAGPLPRTQHSEGGDAQ